MSFRFFFLVISISLSHISIADELSVAMTHYEQGHYDVALEQFTQLAHQNNAEAQYNLAFMYFGGEGVPQDDSKAAYWFEQAAKLAHPAAQDTLAYLYLHGRGVEANKAQAYAWYSVAAENGIFLARNISKNLKKDMTTEDHILADLLSTEYIKKYKKNN